MTHKDLLLEIGVEELPARFVPFSMAALETMAKTRLEAAGLSYKELKTLGTPRRLVVLITDLSTKAKDMVQESLGPAIAQAKDKDGNWTPAAQGFARGQGTTPEKLDVRATDRGERLCAVRHIEGQTADKLLPVLLGDLIRKLTFPKSMVWEESRFAFARPLRWIVALYGTNPVKFEVAGVKSGKKSIGLRFRTPEFFDVTSPSRYVSLLRDRLVVADPAERRSLIEKQVHQAVKSVHGRVPLEKYPDLLEEVSNLVEHPVAILGKFDVRFLSLPPEVLITSMKKHQKFFPVFDADGKLLNSFVGIRNGISENQSVVREGYERVLAARLSDAAFFFEQDRKTSLDDYAQLLKGIVFLNPLTLFDKTSRSRALARQLAEVLSLDSNVTDAADRILFLGKADLMTGIVGEFPELQGVMGRIYAGSQEKAVVAQGIEQHYWPLTAEGALPETNEAALASLADKLDSLAGNFLVGNIPTGSQDPYALRRAAIGVLRIIAERRWKINILEILQFGMRQIPLWDDVKGAKAYETLSDFMKQRWAALMEGRGQRFDEIQAVISVRFGDVVDLEGRLSAVSEIRRHPDFDPLIVAFKRTSNILKQARQKNYLRAEDVVVKENLREPAEKELFQFWAGLEPRVRPFLKESSYSDALKLLVGFRSPVDRFFESVMVMVEDESLRTNRLALLQRIYQLFQQVADLSLLQEVPSDKR